MPLTAFMRGFPSHIDPHDHSAAAHLHTKLPSPRTFGILGDQWIADEIRKAEELFFNSLQEDIAARRRQEMIDAADRGYVFL